MRSRKILMDSYGIFFFPREIEFELRIRQKSGIYIHGEIREWSKVHGFKNYER